LFFFLTFSRSRLTSPILLLVGLPPPTFSNPPVGSFHCRVGHGLMSSVSPLLPPSLPFVAGFLFLLFGTTFPFSVQPHPPFSLPQAVADLVAFDPLCFLFDPPPPSCDGAPAVYSHRFVLFLAPPPPQFIIKKQKKTVATRLPVPFRPFQCLTVNESDSPVFSCAFLFSSFSRGLVLGFEIVARFTWTQHAALVRQTLVCPWFDGASFDFVPPGPPLTMARQAPQALSRSLSICPLTSDLFSPSSSSFEPISSLGASFFVTPFLSAWHQTHPVSPNPGDVPFRPLVFSSFIFSVVWGVRDSFVLPFLLSFLFVPRIFRFC